MSKRINKFSSTPNIIQPQISSLKRLAIKDKRLSRSKLIVPSFTCTFTSTERFNILGLDDLPENEPDLEADATKTALYTIQILSNWGDNKRVSCSAIWFLDENRLQIIPIKIRSTPFSSQNNLQQLSDRVLLKTDDREIWSEKWPPDDYRCITIIYSLPINRTPSSVRIWNTLSSGKSGVKDVVVMHNDEILYKGEIPCQYGTDIKLLQHSHRISIGEIANSISPLCHAFSSLQYPKKERVADDYGYWPLRQTKRIEILFLSNYGNEESVGLNALDIYDENYEPIEIDDIDDFLVENSKSFTDPSKLFKLQKETCNENDMFLMNVKWEEHRIPILTILMKKPKIISQIVFWNYNYIGKLNAGVNHAIIKIDKKYVWVGKVRKALGQKGKVGLSTTSLWLNDIPELREKEYNNNKDDDDS
jgi:hypothetical protein